VEQGLVQVYTGEGKGKSTAATGLLVRALGQGLRVLWVRLLKASEPASGEVQLLRGQPNLEIVEAGLGVIGRQVDPEQLAANVTSTLERAWQQLRETPFDLVVFDELNGALRRGAFPQERFLAWLDQRPAGLEVVITGRYAPESLLQKADLVTDMQNIKHPYAAGIPARRGIEY